MLLSVSSAFAICKDAQGRRLLGTGMMQVLSSSPNVNLGVLVVLLLHYVGWERGREGEERGGSWTSPLVYEPYRSVWWWGVVLYWDVHETCALVKHGVLTDTRANSVPRTCHSGPDHASCWHADAGARVIRMPTRGKIRVFFSCFLCACSLSLLNMAKREVPRATFFQGDHSSEHLFPGGSFDQRCLWVMASL